MPPSPVSGLLRGLVGPLCLVLAAGAGSPAFAERIAIGASVGASRGEGGTSYATDQIVTRGVFGRLRLFGGLAIEAEVGQSELTRDYGDVRDLDCGQCEALGSDFDPSDAKVGTLALRYDVLSAGALRPHLLAGVGVENWRAKYVEWSYSRREVGIGVDLEVAGGLRIGVDVRAGRRSLIDTRISEEFRPLILIAPTETFAGDRADYVNGRITLGAAF